MDALAISAQTGQTAGGFECPTLPAKPQQDLVFKSVYKKSDPQRAEVNKRAQKKYSRQTEDLRKFENDLVLMSNNYLKTKNDAIAQCALNWLYEWAVEEAYLGRTNSQGVFIRQWGLAVVASAFAQIQSSPALDPQKKQVVKAWLLNVAQNVMEDYAGSTSQAIKLQNNHLYWAAWAVTVTSSALNDKELYKWGVNKAKYAILVQMRDDGTLPLEMARGEKALHYHIFAMTPLVLIAETAARNGEDLYDLKNGLLHTAAKRVFEAMKDSTSFAQEAGEPQEDASQISSEHFAWLEVYNSRFPSPEMEAWLEASRPIFSRRAGGDVRFLFRRT